MSLINVKGMGPKVASGMFATGSIKGIIDAINKENLLYLTKFPKIGEKLAKQVILDLKGKLFVEILIYDRNFGFLFYCLVSSRTTDRLAGQKGY